MNAISNSLIDEQSQSELIKLKDRKLSFKAIIEYFGTQINQENLIVKSMNLSEKIIELIYISYMIVKRILVAMMTLKKLLIRALNEKLN